MQDRASSIENHERFVRRVLEARQVWGLKSQDGWAVCDSTEFSERSVMPFWSDRAYAQRAAREAWSHYAPATLTPTQFVETWLVGMSADGILVGTNWDTNNCGLEVEPADLAQQLATASPS